MIIEKEIHIYKELADRLKENRDILNGTVFLNSNVSKVYSLQENFKGIGVYVDPILIGQRAYFTLLNCFNF